MISSHPGSVRLLAYPNSGEGWDAASDSWMGDPDLQPQEFGDAAADWVASGEGHCWTLHTVWLQHAALLVFLTAFSTILGDYRCACICS